MIFLYEPKLLREGRRWDGLVQQDYVNSGGVLFVSKAKPANHRKLQRQFRAGYGAPNHFEQPWFGDYDYPRDVFDLVYW